MFGTVGKLFQIFELSPESRLLAGECVVPQSTEFSWGPWKSSNPPGIKSFSIENFIFYEFHSIFFLDTLYLEWEDYFSRTNNEDKNLSFTTGEVLRDNQMKLTSVD